MISHNGSVNYGLLSGADDTLLEYFYQCEVTHVSPQPSNDTERNSAKRILSLVAVFIKRTDVKGTVQLFTGIHTDK